MQDRLRKGSISNCLPALTACRDWLVWNRLVEEKVRSSLPNSHGEIKLNPKLTLSWMKTFECWLVHVVSLNIIHQTVHLTVPNKWPRDPDCFPSEASFISSDQVLQILPIFIKCQALVDWLIKHPSFMYLFNKYLQGTYVYQTLS